MSLRKVMLVYCQWKWLLMVVVRSVLGASSLTDSENALILIGPSMGHEPSNGAVRSLTDGEEGR